MTIITEASNILEVSEREVFRRAHIAWFGTPDGRREHYDFMAYFTNNQDIPPYARHYCRNLIREFEASQKSFLDLFKEWIQW